MPWTTKYTANTNRDRVGLLTATWTEPTGEQMVFVDEQINTNNAGAKSTFVTRAKARLAAWQTEMNTTKANAAAIESELTTLLNL